MPPPVHQVTRDVERAINERIARDVHPSLGYGHGALKGRVAEVCSISGNPKIEQLLALYIVDGF